MDFERLGSMLGAAANVLRLILELAERKRGGRKERRARHARRTR